MRVVIEHLLEWVLLLGARGEEHAHAGLVVGEVSQPEQLRLAAEARHDGGRLGERLEHHVDLRRLQWCTAVRVQGVSNDPY